MKCLFNFLLCVLSATVSFAQDQSAQLKSVEQELSSSKSVIGILTNASYMPLHSLTAFRELVKRYARQEEITLVSPGEPGQRITVKGKITDEHDKPSSNVLVYVYHMDNKGWYADTAGHVSGMGGDRFHARLFGYFKTNADGSFEFNTIHPQGYPNSNLPQHIHFEVFAANSENLIVTELLFSEDPRLTTSMRQRMSNEGALVAANTGTSEKPVYSYQIRTR